LDDTVSFLEGEEREAFLDLAKGMLVWHPDCKKWQVNWPGILSFNLSRQVPDFEVCFERPT
jgi:hypothetical protein